MPEGIERENVSSEIIAENSPNLEKERDIWRQKDIELLIDMTRKGLHHDTL